METTCKNCNNVFEGNYCNNCGQSAAVKRINWKYIYDDVKGNYLSFNKTKLYSAKELFLRPGYLIRDFLDGKRVNFYKPVSLILFVASVYAYLFHTFNIDPFIGMQSGSSNQGDNKLNLIHDWVNSHFSIASLISVPVFALSFYIIFKKQNYNFSEFLVINTFLAAQRIIVRILVFPVMLILNYSNHLNVFFQILSLADIVLMIWALFQLFGNMSLVKTIFKVLIVYLISYTISIILLFILLLIL